MVETNRFGLSRTIPDPIKREVRQRCGFGCVLCGMAVCQYEHIDPPFSEAKTHDPTAIALLCGSHHDKVSRGLMSKQTIKNALASPRALQHGFSFDTFDVGSNAPSVRLGTLTALRPRTILRVFGENVIEVAPPEQTGGPFRISAVFSDKEGREIFRIKDNVWETPIGNWDVEIVGPRITLRSAPRALLLQLRVEPPDLLVIERLEMYYQGTHINCDERHGFSIETGARKFFQTDTMTLEDCEVVFDVQEQSFFVGVNCAEEHFVEFARFGNVPDEGIRAVQRGFGKYGVSTAAKVDRSDLCPCGSGRRSKECHGSGPT